jgi:DNA ligase (NAD+)
MLTETQHLLQRTVDTITRDEIPTLREVIQYHRAQYYNDTPVITDGEFDTLYALLVAVEEKFQMHDEPSPTKEVARIDHDNHFTKAPHLHQMMSLDNTYDAEDLREFEMRIRRILDKETTYDKLDYVVEYKFDGLGIALLYEQGKLTRALTRGDGQIGEDITLNVREIANIPKTIPYLETIEIRGEVVMSRSSFDELNHRRLQV